MPRTPDQNRDYMRRYRSGKTEPAEEPQVLENRTMRERVERRWINPFDDGMPDTSELIARMTQPQRDRILGHPAIRTKP